MHTTINRTEQQVQLCHTTLCTMNYATTIYLQYRKSEESSDSESDSESET